MLGMCKYQAKIIPVYQLAKAGNLCQWLWPFQLAKIKSHHYFANPKWRNYKRWKPHTTWNTRPSDAESHGHSDRCSHVCRDICTQLRACRFADIGMMVLQRGNKKGGREGGRAWAPAWQRHRSSCSLSYAGAICHPSEHLQTQGALVTQC